jgi:hypothetical protein
VVRPIRFLIAAAVLLAGCAPQGKTGTVTLDSPPDGAIIYSSALTVAGTAQGVNSGGFIVTVTDSAGRVIARKAAADRDSAFEYELVHGYSGEPIPVSVTVTDADAPADPPYATRSITLASIEHRPDGIYVDVLAPQLGDEIGGDEIQVHGRASGLAERTFTVELVGGDGAVITSAAVTLPPGYVADDLPWSAALQPGEATGSALVRVVAPDGAELSIVPVVLSQAAG